MRHVTLFILFSIVVQLFPHSYAQDAEAILEHSDALPLSPLLVRINEVMWMGSDLSTADEWIELTAVPSMTGSVRTERLTLDGWSVASVVGGTEQVIARFSTAQSLGSGEYLIAANYSAAQSRLRSDPHVQTSSMSLPNSKLLLRLRDPQGVLIDEVDDGVGSPFAGANPSGGTKASMERVSAYARGTDPSTWRTAQTSRGWDAGSKTMGTPGFPNGTLDPPDTESPLEATNLRAYMHSGALIVMWTKSTSLDVATQHIRLEGLGMQTVGLRESFVLTGVTVPVEALTLLSEDEFGHVSPGVIISVQPLHKPIIDELLPDPADGGEEWIELVNNHEFALDLSGWVLRSGTRTVTLGSGTVLQPQQRRILSATETNLPLPNAGGQVQLLIHGVVIDTLTFLEAQDGVSWGRYDNGTYPLCTPQPGSANTQQPPIISIDGIVQQGSAPLTLNLQARAVSGSLAGATCSWVMSDGYLSQSCNPPAHTFKVSGEVVIALNVRDYCGNTVQQTRSVFVSQKKSTTTKNTSLRACTPRTYSGVMVSEILAAPPTGEEEWIELYNPGEETLDLCGWSLDDGVGGSRPYLLSGLQVEPGAYRVITQKESGLAINNDQDVIRLIAPQPSGATGVLLSIPLHKAQTGQAYALRSDGMWLWTHYPTPQTHNRFEEVDLFQGPSPVHISAAMPNPQGRDEGEEWIELTNATARPQWLNGWHLVLPNGKEVSLTGTVLAKNEVLRLPTHRYTWTLPNKAGDIQLLDADRHIRSVLAWTHAVEGKPVRQPKGPEPVHPTSITVLDPTTIRAQFVFGSSTLRFTGALADISAHETLHKNEIQNTISALIKEKNIELQSDSTMNKYYVFADGVDVATALLQAGLVYVPGSARGDRHAAYTVYERSAREQLRGLWAQPGLAAVIDERKHQEATDALVREHGVQVRFVPVGGVVASGTVLHITSSIPAHVYVALGSGSYVPHTGGLVLTHDQTVSAYAEYQVKTGSSQVVRSPVVTHEYSVPRPWYSPCITVSEVFPSPAKGLGEWIELYNKCDQQVSLLGWSIDDVTPGGSKPSTFKHRLILQPRGYALLSGSSLNVTLNNADDTVTVFMPNKRVSDSLHYPSVRKGMAYAATGSGYCLTSTPTPGGANTCTVVTKARRTKARTQRAKSIIGIKTVYTALFAGQTSKLNTKIDQSFTYYEGLKGKVYLKFTAKFTVIIIMVFTVISCAVALLSWFVRIRRTE